MKAYFARLASRRASASEREMVERLKAEGPESLNKLNPGVTFDRIWQEQPDQMKRVLPGKRKNRTRFFAAFAVVLLLLGAVIYGSRELKPVSAKLDISGIDFRHLVDEIATNEVRFRGEERIDDFFAPLNIKLEDQGVTLTLVKAYYDGNDVKIDYVVESSDHRNPLNAATATFEYELQLLGLDAEDQSQVNNSIKRTVLDSRHFAGTLTYTFFESNGPEKLALALQVHELANTPGNWQTEIVLNSSETDAQTLTFFPNQTFEYQGYVLKINKIQVGPLWNVIEISRHNPREESNLNIIYSDDLETRFLTGNRSWGSTNPTNDNYLDEIYVLEPFSAFHRKPDALVLTLSKSYLLKAEDVPEKDRKDDTIVQPFDGRLPVTLEGFDGETLTVTDIDMQEGRTVFRMKYNSPNVQSWMPYIKTKKGEILTFNTRSPERISENELIFEAVLGPVNVDDIAAIEAMPFQAPESQKRFEIPLDWSKAVKGRH